MQREILFRGKRVDNGKWVYGSPLRYSDGDMFICVEDCFPDILNKYEVDASTVGQYTGFTDTNGTKIFEGDILSFLDNDGEYTNYKVVWLKNRWLIVECGTNGIDDLDMFFCENSDIIGNIHDNPELLEVSE